MTSDPRSQEEKEKAWRQQVFDEMHSSVPEEWYSSEATGTGSQVGLCPVCAYPMRIVEGIGTVCEHCNRPYHPGHNYTDLSERPWTDWREGGEEIGY